jgi:hypothetical protein
MIAMPGSIVLKPPARSLRLADHDGKFLFARAGAACY